MWALKTRPSKLSHLIPDMLLSIRQGLTRDAKAGLDEESHRLQRTDNVNQLLVVQPLRILAGDLQRRGHVSVGHMPDHVCLCAW